MNQTIAPQPNESREAYTVRAHRQLLDQVPDPDKRNLMVWSAWMHEKGTTGAEQRAEETFGDAEKFVKKPSVCYFVEHETTNNQGEPVRFSLDDLVEITQTCNNRASDRKAFSAISDNHTSPSDQTHQGDPPVLGAVGAYKLGMVGHDKPTWAIFADEYHYTQHAESLAAKPRRSVELITFHDTGERFIDPVAALGGRAPRLCIPAQYSVESNVKSNQSNIERYQFEAGAAGGSYPSGSNTHVKSTDYFGGETEPKNPTESTNMTISDQDISQIVNAIGNMPEFSWCREQMDKESAPEAPEAPADGIAPPTEEGFDDAALGLDGADEFDAGDDMDMDMDIERNGEIYGEASGNQVVTPPAEDAAYDSQSNFEDEQMNYAANPYAANGMKYSAQQGNMSVEQFSALQAEHAALRTSHVGLLNQMGTVAKKLKAADQKAADAQRETAIDRLCERYSTVFDASEEKKRLLYSAGNELSGGQFKAEIDRMETIGSRVSLQQNTIPKGTIFQGTRNASIERNSAWFEKSQEIQLAAANRGESLDWDQLQVETDKQLSGQN